MIAHGNVKEGLTERMTSARAVYLRFVEFEERAASLYLHLASHFSNNPELSSFWLEMGTQEKQHAGLLQFCAFEQLFVEDLPDDAAIERIEGLYRELEKRAADPELRVDDAFQIALELESSEVNNIYCDLTTTTHNSMYLWRRKVVSLAPGHLGFLAAAAQKFGAGEEAIRRLGRLCEKCL